MTPAELIQVITSTATLIGVITSLIVSLRNSREIRKVEAATNGLSAKLIASTDKAARAEGVEQGREEQRQETKAETKRIRL